MPEQHIHIGDSSELATGNLQLAADGDQLMLAANSLDGAVLISGGKAVNLQCGAGMITIAGGPEKADISLQANPLSKITIALGPAVMGPRLVMGADSIEIAMGPPGVGTSIKLTPLSIKLQAATTTYELTGLAGHALAVPGNEYSLGPMGESAKVLNSSVSAQISAKVSGMAQASLEASGQASVKGAIVMIN